MEELLVTAVTALGGESNYVELAKLRENADVKMYFLRTLFKPPWSDETFALYFQSRPEKWEFDEKTRGVKLRSELTKQIGEAQTKQRKTAILPEALYTSILRAGTPRDTVQVIATAKDNELAALPAETFEALMEALDKPPPLPAENDPSYAALAALQPGVVAMHTNAQIKCMTAIPGALEKKGASVEKVMEYFKLIAAFGNSQTDQRVAAQRIATLKELCETAGAMLREKGLAGTSMKAIYMLCQAAPFHVLALAVASLGDKGDGEDIRKDIKTCAACLGKIPAQVLEGINHDTLLRLAVACTKSTGIAEECLGMVAKAAGATLPAWNMDDNAKLLFAVAKAKACAADPAVESLYGRAAEAVAGKLESLTDAQLLKIILALGKVASVKEVVEAAAGEAVKRLPKIPAAQRLLLTQALLPLGSASAQLLAVLESWAADGGEATEKLSGDQAAKLAQLVAPVASEHAEFWKAVGARLVVEKSSLTDAGKASVAAAFPDGAGPAFPDKDKLLAAVKPKAKEKEKEKEKERDRDRDGKKEEEKAKPQDRDARKRSRSRDDRRNGGDEKRDSRRDDKKRGRSRSRSRDRRRR